MKEWTGKCLECEGWLKWKKADYRIHNKLYKIVDYYICQDCGIQNTNVVCTVLS